MRDTWSHKGTCSIHKPAVLLSMVTDWFKESSHSPVCSSHNSEEALGREAKAHSTTHLFTDYTDRQSSTQQKTKTKANLLCTNYPLMNRQGDKGGNRQNSGGFSFFLYAAILVTQGQT